MKRLVLVLGCLMISLSVFAQIEDPVHWEVSKEVNENGEVRVIMSAAIDEGWHIYSSKLPEDAGPIPTYVEWEESENYTVKGELAEPDPIQEYDESFMAELMFFSEKVTFSQSFSVKNAVGEILGTLTYMVCNEGMCLPPTDVNIKIELN